MLKYKASSPHRGLIVFITTLEENSDFSLTAWEVRAQTAHISSRLITCSLPFKTRPLAARSK